MSDITGDEREAIVKIRINQDKFRESLIKKYNGKCCLCGVDYLSMLVASHIKPWAKSDKYEKLDIENGLLLCPNHDKLFDSGLISFDSKGKIMISSKLDKNNQIFFSNLFCRYRYLYPRSQYVISLLYQFAPQRHSLRSRHNPSRI